MCVCVGAPRLFLKVCLCSGPQVVPQSVSGLGPPGCSSECVWVGAPRLLSSLFVCLCVCVGGQRLFPGVCLCWGPRLFLGVCLCWGPLVVTQSVCVSVLGPPVCSLECWCVFFRIPRLLLSLSVCQCWGPQVAPQSVCVCDRLRSNLGDPTQTQTD